MRKYILMLLTHPLFRGLSKDDIEHLLDCIKPRVRAKKSGEYFLLAGDTTDCMGLVLSGAVVIVQDDFWGRRHIMSRIMPGGIFAEPFAAIPGLTLNVSAVADGDAEVLMLNVRRLLTVCGNACSFHNTVVRNLVEMLTQKTLVLNEKITHMSHRTTREKLLSFLSAEAARSGALTFDIGFNRQELADYLCVERAAMSVELSKLQSESVIRYSKNHFELLKPAAL